MRHNATGLLLLLLSCADKPPPPCPPGPQASAPTATPAIADAGPLPDAGPPEPALAAVELTSLPGWHSDAIGDALPALRATCGRVSRLADAEKLDHAAIGGSAADWRPLCADLTTADGAGVREVLARHLVAYAPREAEQRAGLFTGYYQEHLHGARRPSDRYRTPLYARPRDLIEARLADFGTGAGTLWGRVRGRRFIPYSSRAELRAAEKQRGGKPLLWVDDPIAAFFAQIQGSAVVEIEGEPAITLGFAGKNGHPYTAIGRELVALGELPVGGVSMQSIRGWLETNPERAAEIMDKNASYVFFAEDKRPGARGAAGVLLTAGRSLAVDRDRVPLGIPLWVDTQVPAGGAGTMQPFQRLMVAQDAGAGIRGAVRGDMYFGAGPDAADVAGRMSSRGRWFLLLPRTIDVSAAR